jgi:hypothetical protein
MLSKRCPAIRNLKKLSGRSLDIAFSRLGVGANMHLHNVLLHIGFVLYISLVTTSSTSGIS